MKESKSLPKRGFWKRLIEEQKQSGLTQAEFCTARGIPVGSFSSWCSVFKKQAEKEKGNLVRVEVAKSVEPMRIVFQNGVSLYFGERPDPAWLTELMKLVS